MQCAALHLAIVENGVAVLTGSSGGIGTAMAIAFTGEGCKGLVNYHHGRERALEVAGRIEKMRLCRYAGLRELRRSLRRQGGGDSLHEGLEERILWVRDHG